ncbi:MAG: hypothetical protein KDK55_03315 [Chlamydiia bacterium]|nr:hypothetical protein [Chlamydiia bacterium]
MKELKSQLQAIWKNLSPLQRIATLLVGVFLTCLMVYLICFPSSSSNVPLFPNRHLKPKELEEIRSYLDVQTVEYFEKEEGEFFVPKEEVRKLRGALAQMGIPGEPSSKGFELFDSNLWIKGEKELQVLEKRALKGQLEKDLAAFDQIKSASVILDLAPSHPLRGEAKETKASVILSLAGDTDLSPSQLRAITYHLTGAVRDLKPTMIAISDTRGRLYQAIDPSAKAPIFWVQEELLEKHLSNKIEGLLTKILGKERFYYTLKATLDEEKVKPSSLYSGLTALDLSLVLAEGDKHSENIKPMLEREISFILAPHHVPLLIHFSFAPLEPPKSEKKEGTRPLIYPYFLSVFLLIFFLSALYFWIKREKKENLQLREQDVTAETGGVDHLMLRLQSETLYSLLSDEDPKSLAAFFAEFEKEKAEKLIAILPMPLQKEVIKALIERNVYEMPS